MTCRAAIATEAQREYEDIVGYLAETLDSPAAAREFAGEFAHQLALVREMPQMRPLCRVPELAARGYHCMPVKRYVALYKVLGDLVIIAHIFHQSQDYARLV